MTRRLALRSEALSALTDDELATVAGGTFESIRPCDNTYDSICPTFRPLECLGVTRELCG